MASYLVSSQVESSLLELLLSDDGEIHAFVSEGDAITRYSVTTSIKETHDLLARILSRMPHG